MPLSILRSVEPYEVREPQFDKNGNQTSFRRHIFRLKMNVNDVLAVARKELPTPQWYRSKSAVVGNWWFIDETKSPFVMSPTSITIRANRIEPDSMAVLGPLSDSKVWTTVTVKEARPSPNVGAALWNWVRKTLFPPKVTIVKTRSSSP